MKIKRIVLGAVVGLIIIASCKKNNNAKSNSLLGNWNFVSEQVSGQNTTQYSSGGTAYKTITTSNYTTVGNIGTLNITASTMNASGISYFISDTLINYNYQNGQFIDTSSSIQTQYVQPFSFSLGYVAVGNDSVYFPSGSFMVPADYPSSGPSGAKINISGDSLLTMTTYYTKDSNIFLYGMPATLNIQATLMSKFRR